MDDDDSNVFLCFILSISISIDMRDQPLFFGRIWCSFGRFSNPKSFNVYLFQKHILMSPSFLNGDAPEVTNLQ